jgi:glycosyltransferase involved in cell wall biosynthesis
MSFAEPRHVLYLVDTFYGGLAGAEGTLMRIGRLLPKDRYRCSLATFSTDAPFAKLDPSSPLPFPVHVFPLRRTYGWGALKVARQLRSLIRSERVSIVHTFFETSDLWGGLVAKLSGCRVLISGRRDLGIYRSKKHRLAYRAMGFLYDQVQAVSEEVRGYCIRQDRLDPAKVVTVYNGVELDRLERAAGADLGALTKPLEGASHVVVSVGNIRRIKGFDVLIAAARLVCRELPRTLFIIAGSPMDAACFQSLRERVEENGLHRNVYFAGPVREVAALLKRADVFCLLSRSEGLPNALLEAMACGLPSVVTRVGGNAEVTEDGRSAFLVPVDDATTAARRILELLRDRELAGRMGSVGRQIVEARFNAASMVDRLVNLYDGLLDHRSQNGSLCLNRTGRAAAERAR